MRERATRTLSAGYVRADRQRHGQGVRARHGYDRRRPLLLRGHARVSADRRRNGGRHERRGDRRGQDRPRQLQRLDRPGTRVAVHNGAPSRPVVRRCEGALDGHRRGALAGRAETEPQAADAAAPRGPRHRLFRQGVLDQALAVLCDGAALERGQSTRGQRRARKMGPARALGRRYRRGARGRDGDGSRSVGRRGPVDIQDLDGHRARPAAPLQGRLRADRRTDRCLRDRLSRSGFSADLPGDGQGQVAPDLSAIAEHRASGPGRPHEDLRHDQFFPGPAGDG